MSIKYKYKQTLQIPKKINKILGLKCFSSIHLVKISAGIINIAGNENNIIIPEINVYKIVLRNEIFLKLKNLKDNNKRIQIKTSEEYGLNSHE